jgi:hypothetical protein
MGTSGIELRTLMHPGHNGEDTSSLTDEADQRQRNQEIIGKEEKLGVGNF